MGTRCVTSVRSRWDEGDWQTHAVIYRHWDGYLTGGHGEWLYDFLAGMEVINGIPGDPPPKYANGPGRLAAQLVAKLQEDGHSPDLRPNYQIMGQEFHYQIDVQHSNDGGTVSVTVFDGPMTMFGYGGERCTEQIFQGTVEEYGKFLEEQRNGVPE